MTAVRGDEPASTDSVASIHLLECTVTMAGRCIRCESWLPACGRGGDPPGCVDSNGVALLDRVSADCHGRGARCDVGAYEFRGLAPGRAATTR